MHDRCELFITEFPHFLIGEGKLSQAGHNTKICTIPDAAIYFWCCSYHSAGFSLNTNKLV
jgi:hypothetical protein